MYRDLFIVFLTILVIVSIYRHYHPETIDYVCVTVSDVVYGIHDQDEPNKNSNKATMNISEETDSLFNAPNDIPIKVSDDTNDDNLFEKPQSIGLVKNKVVDPLDDKFLYSDNEMDIVYGESREKESHCACEMPINDNYYDNGDDEFQDDSDDEPIHAKVDRYNEETRHRHDEEVDKGFDGIYQDNMYEIEGNRCHERGHTTFATY